MIYHHAIIRTKAIRIVSLQMIVNYVILDSHIVI